MCGASETMHMRTKTRNVAVLLEHARGLHCKVSCSKIPHAGESVTALWQVAVACLLASPPLVLTVLPRAALTTNQFSLATPQKHSF